MEFNDAQLQEAVHQRAGDAGCAARSAAVLVLLFVAVATLLAGCQSAYFGALEKIGIAKRELLLDRVDAARDSQGEAEQAYMARISAREAYQRALQTCQSTKAWLARGSGI